MPILKDNIPTKLSICERVGKPSDRKIKASFLFISTTDYWSLSSQHEQCLFACEAFLSRITPKKYYIPYSPIIAQLRISNLKSRFCLFVPGLVFIMYLLHLFYQVPCINPYTVQGNIWTKWVVSSCNCFLFSHEGSSIITFTYLVFSMRQSVFAVYSSSSQRSSQNYEIVNNWGSYLWPKLVKHPIAVPNQIIWTRRKGL